MYYCITICTIITTSCLSVSAKKITPPREKTHGNISLKNTTSGEGEQFMLLDCGIRACVQGVFCSQTPVL